MGCSIINDTIQLHVEGSEKTLDVLLPASKKLEPKTKITSGSALQNPDLSKMSLSSMLRRVRRDTPSTTGTSQKNYWVAFMERTRSQCANTNAE
ncbi:MAG: hypothetical protein ACK4NR_01010 [Micavibrio sp.]